MKLSSQAYDFAKKLLSLSEKSSKEQVVETNTSPLEKQLEKTTDSKRIIGSTDYNKYEKLSKEIEKEEISSNPKTKEVLKMGCNNDLRKERELYEKPSSEKIEASQIFKSEGDEKLREKNYEEALKIYDKALLQLFYTFADNGEENKKVDKVKLTLNLNISVCKIKLEKYDDAIGYLSEVLRIDPNHLKSIYRIAYCYFMLDKLKDSLEYIDKGLTIEANNTEFINLKNDIEEKEKQREKNTRNLFSKILNK